MKRETRVIKRFTDEVGTLSEGDVLPARVRFSLTVTRDFIDGIPGMMDGFGTIQFIDPRRAGEFFSSRGSATLKNENVQAEILVIALGEFKTTGSISYAGVPAA